MANSQRDNNLPPWLQGIDEERPITREGQIDDDFLSAADNLPQRVDTELTYDSWFAMQRESARTKSVEEEIPDLLDEMPSDRAREGDTSSQTGELPDWFLGLETLDTSDAPEWFTASAPPFSTDNLVAPPPTAAPPTQTEALPPWLMAMPEATPAPQPNALSGFLNAYTPSAFDPYAEEAAADEGYDTSDDPDPMGAQALDTAISDFFSNLGKPPAPSAPPIRSSSGMGAIDLTQYGRDTDDGFNTNLFGAPDEDDDELPDMGMLGVTSSTPNVQQDELPDFGFDEGGENVAPGFDFDDGDDSSPNFDFDFSSPPPQSTVSPAASSGVDFAFDDYDPPFNQNTSGAEPPDPFAEFLAQPQAPPQPSASMIEDPDMSWFLNSADANDYGDLPDIPPEAPPPPDAYDDNTMQWLGELQGIVTAVNQPETPFAVSYFPEYAPDEGSPSSASSGTQTTDFNWGDVGLTLDDAAGKGTPAQSPASEESAMDWLTALDDLAPPPPSTTTDPNDTNPMRMGRSMLASRMVASASPDLAEQTAKARSSDFEDAPSEYESLYELPFAESPLAQDDPSEATSDSWDTLNTEQDGSSEPFSLYDESTSAGNSETYQPLFPNEDSVQTNSFEGWANDALGKPEAASSFDDPWAMPESDFYSSNLYATGTSAPNTQEESNRFAVWEGNPVDTNDDETDSLPEQRMEIPDFGTGLLQSAPVEEFSFSEEISAFDDDVSAEDSFNFERLNFDLFTETGEVAVVPPIASARDRLDQLLPQTPTEPEAIESGDEMPDLSSLGLPSDMWGDAKASVGTGAYQMPEDSFAADAFTALGRGEDAWANSRSWDTTPVEPPVDFGAAAFDTPAAPPSDTNIEGLFEDLSSDDWKAEAPPPPPAPIKVQNTMPRPVPQSPAASSAGFDLDALLALSSPFVDESANTPPAEVDAPVPDSRIGQPDASRGLKERLIVPAPEMMAEPPTPPLELTEVADELPDFGALFESPGNRVEEGADDVSMATMADEFEPMFDTDDAPPFTGNTDWDDSLEPIEIPEPTLAPTPTPAQTEDMGWLTDSLFEDTPPPSARPSALMKAQVDRYSPPVDLFAGMDEPAAATAASDEEMPALDDLFSFADANFVDAQSDPSQSVKDDLSFTSGQDMNWALEDAPTATHSQDDPALWDEDYPDASIEPAPIEAESIEAFSTDLGSIAAVPDVPLPQTDDLVLQSGDLARRVRFWRTYPATLRADAQDRIDD